jgi:hypothetical protein
MGPSPWEIRSYDDDDVAPLACGAASRGGAIRPRAKIHC